MGGMAKRLPPEVLAFLRKQGAKGGKIGGKRSLQTMTVTAETMQRLIERADQGKRQEAEARLAATEGIKP